MKKSLLQILFFAALVLVSCKGKDGDPGPTGATGAAGDTGAKGDNGADGVAYDQATNEGNIVITLSGKRPDNVDFTIAQDFKYHADGDNPSNESNFYKDTNTGTSSFRVVRYLGAVDEHVNDNYFEIGLDVSSTGAIQVTDMYLATAVVDGTKYFGVSEGDASVFTISNYSYDATTGKLKFNFSGTFASSYSTGHDLTVSGVANVNVYESLNN